MKQSRAVGVLSGACVIALVGCPKPVEPPADATSDVVVSDSTMDAAEAACVDGSCNSAAFRPGPYGTSPRDLAGPFTVPTTQGPWSFEQQFTGQDHYVFLVYTPGTFRFSNGTDLSQALFDGPLDELLTKSPRNVHYFFLWNRNEQGFNEFVTNANNAFALLSAEDQAHWRPRVHFVTQQANMLPGWVGNLVRTRISAMLPYKRYDPFQFAIDRNQRVREVGQLGTLTNGGIAPDLTYLAHEPQYYEFEAQREDRLRADNATVVNLVTNQRVDDWEGPRNWRDAVQYAEANLPDAATMARFDTLEVDFEMHCPSHRDGECGAWDYIADLRICEDVAPSADAGVDGASDAARADANDGDANNTDASSDASGDAAEEMFRPRRAGCDREVARWITPYWREGRWVTDISQMLPLIAQGGRRTFRWYSKHQFDPREVPYYISLSFRLSNRSRGMRPSEVRTLWSSEGEAFNSTYDSRHAPQTFTVPAGVRKVELYSLITGHGAESGQCAEFCNHTHSFTVNGAAPSVIRFPEAQTGDGCALRVNEGVAPNQHGTWYFGRGGWCPGQDVRPHVTDITAQLRMGQSNTVAYTTGLNGNPLTAGRSYGSINHVTYLIFWR
jgi:hypothetical protein